MPSNDLVIRLLDRKTNQIVQDLTGVVASATWQSKWRRAGRGSFRIRTEDLDPQLRTLLLTGNISVYLYLDGFPRATPVSGPITELNWTDGRFMQFSLGWQNVRNEIIVLGKGEGSGQRVVRRSSPESQSRIGLRERTFSASNLETPAEYEDAGDREVIRYTQAQDRIASGGARGEGSPFVEIRFADNSVYSEWRVVDTDNLAVVDPGNVSAAEYIEALVNENLLSPVLGRRTIDVPATFKSSVGGGMVDAPVRWSNLADTIEDACIAGDVGFQSTLLDDGRVEFSAPVPTDRRSGTSDAVILSTDLASIEHDIRVGDQITCDLYLFRDSVEPDRSYDKTCVARRVTFKPDQPLQIELDWGIERPTLDQLFNALRRGSQDTKGGWTTSDNPPPAPVQGSGWYNQTNEEFRVYNGSTWEIVGAGGSPGNITGVIAGTGLTGGGNSGQVTLAVENPFTNTDEIKLDSIETGATTDQSGSEIVDAIDTSLGSDDWQHGGGIGNITDVVAGDGLGGGGSSGHIRLDVDNPFTTAEEQKLAGIEPDATTDQSGSEIVDAIDTSLGNDDWQHGGTGDITDVVAGNGLGGGGSSGQVTLDVDNPFTPTDEIKLDGIEPDATADQTGPEIVGAIDTSLGNDDWQHGGIGDITDVVAGDGLNGGGSSGPIRLDVDNPFTLVEDAKLAGIEPDATADQSGSEIVDSIDTSLGSDDWQQGGGGGGVGDITDVVAGSGLSGGGSSGQVTLDVDNPFTLVEDAKLVSIEYGSQVNVPATKAEVYQLVKRILTSCASISLDRDDINELITICTTGPSPVGGAVFDTDTFDDPIKGFGPVSGVIPVGGGITIADVLQAINAHALLPSVHHIAPSTLSALAGTISDAQVPDNLVTSRMLTQALIGTVYLVNGAVTEAKLHADVVAQLGGGGVTTQQVADAIIAHADLANVHHVPPSISTGDITAVVAGVGITGGGDSGDVTVAVSNPFTPIEAVKLASVETDATADQTGAEIVSSIDSALGDAGWQGGGGGGVDQTARNAAAAAQADADVAQADAVVAQNTADAATTEIQFTAHAANASAHHVKTPAGGVDTVARAAAGDAQTTADAAATEVQFDAHAANASAHHIKTPAGGDSSLFVPTIAEVTYEDSGATINIDGPGTDNASAGGIVAFQYRGAFTAADTAVMVSFNGHTAVPVIIKDVMTSRGMTLNDFARWEYFLIQKASPNFIRIGGNYQIAVGGGTDQIARDAAEAAQVDADAAQVTADAAATETEFTAHAADSSAHHVKTPAGGGGDITGVAAGTGLSGGGNAGQVTLTVSNPFTNSDESKLDGIETGATTDQSGSEIVSKIDTELSNENWKHGGFQFLE